MKILITGSSGYVGRSFMNVLKGTYNFLTFSLQEDSLDNLDIKNIDIVLHCAALVHQKVEYDYQRYYDINVKYPVSLAKKAKKNGVRQFIFISTVAVYGGNKTLLKESTACGPISPYGKSKLQAEKELLELNDEGFIVSIIRPPMVYGKNAPGNIQSLIKIIQKVPILPFGQIKNRRSFVYIDNLCSLIDATVKKQKAGIFLASDDHPLSTSELIQVIAHALNRKVYLPEIPFFETMLKQLKPAIHNKLYNTLEIDNHLTKEMLDFKNPYSVEEGIKFMIEGKEK